MTKREKELESECERLRSELQVSNARLQVSNARLALYWTPPVDEDVRIPTGNEVVNGWLPKWPHFDMSRLTAIKACSSAVSHNVGAWDRTTTQGARALYSTKLLALQSARNIFCVEVGTALALLDEEMERSAHDRANYLGI